MCRGGGLKLDSTLGKTTLFYSFLSFLFFSFLSFFLSLIFFFSFFLSFSLSLFLPFLSLNLFYYRPLQFCLSLSFLFICFIRYPVQLILFICLSVICFAQHLQNSFVQSKSYNAHACYRTKHLRLLHRKLFLFEDFNLSLLLSFLLGSESLVHLTQIFTLARGEMAIVLINNFLTLICKKLSSASFSRNRKARRVGKLSSTKVHF